MLIRKFFYGVYCHIIPSSLLRGSSFFPKKLSKKAKNILLDPELTKYISAITFWEISLKFALKKLDLTGVLPDQLPGFAKKMGFEILNLDAQTASSFYKLKLPKIKNKDPFDRILAWQAISADYQFLSQDPDFLGYKDFGLKVI